MCSTHDSKYLFISDDIGQLTQIDVDAKEIAKGFGKIHQGGIYSMVVTPESDFLFTSSEFGILRQYDIESSKIFKDYKKIHNGSIYSIIIHDKHNVLFVSNDKGELKQISLMEIQERNAKPAIYDNGKIVDCAIMSMKVTPDSEKLFICSEKGNLTMWSLTKVTKFNYFEITYLKEFKLNLHFYVDAFDFSTDSRLLYTTDRARNLRIWDMQNCQLIKTLDEVHQDRIWTIKIIPCILPNK